MTPLSRCPACGFALDRALEDIFADIAAAGFLVNNLFHCNTRQWQANLRSPAGHTRFHIADTPAAALEGCLLSLNDLVAPIERSITFSIEGPRRSLSDLLAMNSSREPIKRRV